MNQFVDAHANHGRANARLNPTVAALMQRRVDSDKARALHAAGYTLAKLKVMKIEALRGLGLGEEPVAAILGGRRVALPFENLARVLWSNRYTCCVCRDPSLAIIVHHIEPWAESRDHGTHNLAVLCLEHHARAHRRGDLEQNLTPQQLKQYKTAWEEEVARLDARAILDASRIEGHHWWWFNHVRVLELAQQLGIKLTRLTRYLPAFACGAVDRFGSPSHEGEVRSYMYEGGNGIRLYGYMREVVESVLAQSAVFNISDDLDPGFLGRVISRGDLILVEGRHFFRPLTKVMEGPGQASEVRREANHVRVSFTIDRYEAVASSSWAGWLKGVQSASSILRVQQVEHGGGKLHLHCTGLAIGSPLRGLSTRSYAWPTWQQRDESADDEEEDWLAGFAER
jgi:hypothetical protein